MKKRSVLWMVGSKGTHKGIPLLVCAKGVFMSELYALPEGWEWKKLDDFTTIKSGKRVPKGCKLSDEETPYPYIRVTDFSDNESIDTSDIKYITEEIYLKIKNYTITDNDIYISVAGTIGKTGIIPSELNGANLTENAVKIVFDNGKYDKRYLLNFTNSITFMEQIGLATKTVAMPKLAIKRLKEVNIPLPPLQEQKRIVAKLDSLFAKIDQAITLHQQNIDEAEGFMGSVLNEVFGELEGKYEKDNLNNLTYLITKGSTPTTYGYEFLDKGINFLKIENIINGEVNIASLDKFISEEAHQSQKRSILQENDVLFSIAGTIGDTAIVKKEHLPMNTNQAVALIRPKEKLDSNFLRRVLSSSISDATVNKKRGGAIKNVSLTDIKAIIVPVPPLLIQQKTVTYLDQLSQKTEKLKQAQSQKMESLKALKASLLDRAFRGEL